MQNKIIAKVEEITKIFDEKINNEVDDDKKKDHEKGKKT